MREMKDSGVRWIGKIPTKWTIAKAKNCVEIQNGSDPKTEGSIPVYGSGSMSFKTCGEYKEGPSVLIGRKGATLHIPHYISSKFWNVDTAFNVYSKSIFDLKYYFYCAHVFDYTLYMSQTTLPSMTQTAYENMFLPLPTKEEQYAIANQLDQICSKIDAVLEKTRASIEEYKKLKQAVITQAVTKGIRGDRPMKDSGIEWIGDIPAEWTASKIKYCTEFAPSCNTSHLSEDSLVTFTPMECIKNGYFENREAHFSALSSSYTQYQDGDIVFAKVTPCFENGNIAIMQGLSAGVGFGSSELFVIRPQSINTEFIFYYLQNDIFKQYACATMTGTGGLKRVSPTFVRNYSVFIPCNEEQLEIVRYLNEKCSGIEVLIAKKQQYLTEIENYKKSLIYEYVTGKKEVHPL